LSLSIACLWVSASSIAPVKTPQPPIYPPRWSATASFKFFYASNGSLGAEGVLYQVIDSVSLRFRADDLYFAGSFESTYDAIFITNTSNVYARLVNGSMDCSNYPQKPRPMTQHWIADWCIYNSTVYHGATQAYRWDCKADVVDFSIDTSVPDGLPVYQTAKPQPLFDVYQELWFTSFNILEEIDQSIFFPEAGWNCPKN